MNALLGMGADPDARLLDQLPSLQVAAAMPEDSRIEWVTMMLSAGAMVDSRSASDETALFAACRLGETDMVELLLAAGANVLVACQDRGFSPLHVAAFNGHVNVCQLLVGWLAERGSGVDLVTKDGMTPLHLAAGEGHEAVCMLLMDAGGAAAMPLSSAAPGMYTDDLQSRAMPITTAAVRGHAELALKMAARTWGAENTAKVANMLLTEYVCSNGMGSAVKVLADAGADIGSVNPKFDMAPIHVAAGSGNTDVVQALVDQGVNVDQTNAKGMTPLHCAALTRHRQTVEALFAMGADPTARTLRGSTYEDSWRQGGDPPAETTGGGYGPLGSVVLAGLAGLGAVSVAKAFVSAASSHPVAAVSIGALAAYGVTRPRVGEVVAIVDAAGIHPGTDPFSEPIFHIDGSSIRRGSSAWGDVVATIDGDSIREGAQEWGRVIANVEGDRVREGEMGWVGSWQPSTVSECSTETRAGPGPHRRSSNAGRAVPWRPWLCY